MDEKDLIKRIIKKTKEKELVWVKNKTKSGIIFNCRLDIHNKKKLILKVYLHDILNKSFLDIKMSNGVSIVKMDIEIFSEIYDLLSVLDRL